MDRLNTAIAEKVLEISNTESNNVREKLQKINRFRDFINACQSLIKKYPEIETELLQMIHDNDFNTRIAATRVDTIIRLSENQTINNTVSDIKEDIHQLEDIIDNLPTTNNNSTPPIETSKKNLDTSKEDIPHQKEIEGHPDPKILPEAEAIDKEKEKQYVDFEEITNTDNATINSTGIDNAINSKEQPNISINDKKSKKEGGMSTTKKTLWVVAILALIVVLWIVIKFIINHWNTILWILGVCVVLTLLFWYLFKKKKK